MSFTNKLNLPQAIVDAVINDGYTKGNSDFSVTELLKPSRQWALGRKHKDEIEEDVADRIYALYGQIAHGILERANKKDLVEKRFQAKFGNYIVSGQIDSLGIEDGTISDFKFSTAYSFMLTSPPKDEWIAQLNMQAEILRQNGIFPKALQIIGLIRDFSLRDSQSRTTYPKTPIVIQPIPMWSSDDTKIFIVERISSHIKALETLPECTKAETWSGRRCDNYCFVNNFCETYTTKKGAKENVQQQRAY